MPNVYLERATKSSWPSQLLHMIEVLRNNAHRKDEGRLKPGAKEIDHGHDKSKTNYEHPTKKFQLWSEDYDTRTPFKETLHLTTRPSHKFEFSG
jgi:hypothetical protein